MTGRKQTGGRSDYHRSPEFRAIANAALARYNARRPYLPKCGARRKRDGEPCQNLALGNGRCRCHGGKTPSGDGWHRPVWPNGDAPDAEAKLYRKLRSLERAARARAARLGQMTDEDRERHEQWHKARPATTAKARAENKRLKLDAQQARKLMTGSAPSPAMADPEYLALAARIAEVRARLAALREEHGNSGRVELAGRRDEGVFG